MKYLHLWFVASIIYFFSYSGQFLDTFNQVISATSFCVFIFFFLKTYISENIKIFLPYILFFVVTFTSLFGLTETLTGFYAGSKKLYLFGLSFYTTSLAYIIFNNRQLTIKDAIKVSNPLLLATGPIALFIKNFKYRSFKKRFNYFYPFVIIGIFYYQVIAVPLTETFQLIEFTDLVSSLTFACIFELFVYSNFCGLSLIIYGLFGILGYKVPLNFKQPFSSSNVIDFWKGWHLSLSTVLKSLFYNPLRKKFSTTTALLVVYLSSALWHGVTINFLLWGLFQAMMFIITIYLLKFKIKYLPLIVLLIAIILGRFLFLESQTDRLLEKLTFSFDGFNNVSLLMTVPNTSKISLILGFFLIVIEFFFQKTKIMSKRNYKHLRNPLVLFIITAIGILLINNSIGYNFAVYGQR